MFETLPPEINSTLIYTGPGAQPLLEAAVAWEGLAAELSNAAVSYTGILSTLSAAWLGSASLTMQAATQPYVSWMSETAGMCTQISAQCLSQVAAFESAFAATVNPALVARNRVTFATLVATNLLGQNTPAIMATEAQYVEMWAQDVGAMFGYQTATFGQSVTDFVEAPLTGLDIFSPGSNAETSGIAGLLNLFSGATGSAFGTWLNSGSMGALVSSGFFYSAPLSGIQAVTSFGFLTALAGAESNSPAQTEVPNVITPASPFNASTGLLKPFVAISPGGNSIGGLSVPPSWGVPAESPKVSPLSRPPISAVPEPSPMLPMPFGTTGMMPKGDREQPRYGVVPKIVQRCPAAG